MKKTKISLTKWLSLLTVAVTVAVFCLNFLFYRLELDSVSYLDLTPETLYTLSDEMKTECAFLSDLKNDDGSAGEIRMIFCADPDTLIDSLKTRVVYFMAKQLQKLHPNFAVETVNVSLNPTAVSKYQTTSLNTFSESDIIITYGRQYRITTVDSFWHSDSSGNLASYDGEYRLATLLESITAKNQPKAYFVTGHGENVFDPAANEYDETRIFVNLLQDVGLDVALLDLTVCESIPSDCSLLVINNPKSDFSTEPDTYHKLNALSEIEIIDRYLTEEYGSLAVARDYAADLPVLDEYLREWGFTFSDSVVKEESAGSSSSSFIALYDDDNSQTPCAYQIYGSFVDRTSAPRVKVADSGAIKCVIADEGRSAGDIPHNVIRSYFPFLLSPDTAETFDKDGNLTGEGATRDLAGITAITYTDPDDSSEKTGYVFAAASGSFFSDELLGNYSYANSDIVAAAMKFVSRTDSSASSALGGYSMNSSRYGGKILLDTSIVTEETEVVDPLGTAVIETNRPMPTAMTVVIILLITLLPIAVGVCGAVIMLRRRFL